jgi:hypothetical protein
MFGWEANNFYKRRVGGLSGQDILLIERVEFDGKQQ